MTEYSNTNRGTLGKNKNPKSEKSPPYSGKLNVEGVDYWVSGWVQKNGQTGEPFFSLSLQRCNSDAATAGKPVQSSEPLSTAPDFDDDIPF